MLRNNPHALPETLKFNPVDIATLNLNLDVFKSTFKILMKPKLSGLNFLKGIYKSVVGNTLSKTNCEKPLGELYEIVKSAIVEKVYHMDFISFDILKEFLEQLFCLNRETLEYFWVTIYIISHSPLGWNTDNSEKAKTRAVKILTSPPSEMGQERLDRIALDVWNYIAKTSLENIYNNTVSNIEEKKLSIRKMGTEMKCWLKIVIEEHLNAAQRAFEYMQKCSLIPDSILQAELATSVEKLNYYKSGIQERISRYVPNGLIQSLFFEHQRSLAALVFFLAGVTGQSFEIIFKTATEALGDKSIPLDTLVTLFKSYTY